MDDAIALPPRAMLRALFARAVDAVLPEQAMPDRLPSSLHGRTAIIAVGKAAGEMMRIAQHRAPHRLEGLVVTRYGHLPPGLPGWPGVEIIEAGHPFPDANSVHAASRALGIASGLKSGDRLVVLLSGGGSAVMAAPVCGVTLADKQTVTRALLASGATIAEINCVRKHLSAVKGGRLAMAAAPAEVTTLIISDVPGDDPSLVSSGPTVGDRTTLAEARAVLSRYAIEPPAAITNALHDEANETPCPDALSLAGNETTIIACARDALDAAGDLARSHGFAVTDLGDTLQGESRALGAAHAGFALQKSRERRRLAIISGGETTVTVADRAGRGGRNLEYLLGLAIALDGAPAISALACDTDGIDGTEDAAGAMIFPDTLARARTLDLDAAAYLARNDAYSFFDRLGDLVVTGPTLTNVNDFRAILIDPEA